jgi:hypothetical protein
MTFPTYWRLYMTAIGSPERQAESQGPLIYGLSITFVILSCTRVLLRLYTRYAVATINFMTMKGNGSTDFPTGLSSYTRLAMKIPPSSLLKY